MYNIILQHIQKNAYVIGIEWKIWKTDLMLNKFFYLFLTNYLGMD
jgi:hypothetical protein